MIILCRKCDIMRTQKVTNVEPRKNNSHLMLSAAAGAAAGIGSRYVIPTKNEFSQLINKDAVDTFVSNTATVARGSKRSMLKYGGIGAAVAVGVTMLSKLFAPKNRQYQVEYSKYEALMDTPADSAYAIMWYGDSKE